jgi:eukaryotic-like serine/threonine-protein kinase
MDPQEPTTEPPEADDSTELFADNVGQTACHKCGNVVDCSQAKPFTVVECPQCNAHFSAPGQLGQFILLKIMGKGAMGATYKAYDRTLGRYVAIKAMHRKLGKDQKRVDAFFAEARALAALNHPNVAQVYSLGTEKEQPYIVMELISGGQLDRLYNREKPLEESRAMDLLIDVAEGLKAAGNIGLIHGDVKPANILLDDQGVAKLVDFGVARLGGGQVAKGDALGTPYYVAPEQILRKTVDLRTDIYSLGATLYHALTGQQAFKGKDVKEVLRARLTGPIPDPRSVRPDLREETAALVMRMMSREPAGRQSSYDELLADMWKTYQAIMQKAIDTHQAAQAATPATNTTAPVDLSQPSLIPARPAKPAPTRRPVAPKREKRDFTALVIILLGLLSVLAVVLVLIWWSKHSV